MRICLDIRQTRNGYTFLDYAGNVNEEWVFEDVEELKTFAIGYLEAIKLKVKELK